MSEAQPTKRTLTGKVTSDKMDKSVVIAVDRFIKHPLYGKYVKNRMKYMAHDEKNECGVGDTVLIEESRPKSKNKRWAVRDILEKAK